MPVLVARGNHNTVASIEHLRAGVELDLEPALENLSDVADAAPMGRHLRGVFD